MKHIGSWQRIHWWRLELSTLLCREVAIFGNKYSENSFNCWKLLIAVNTKVWQFYRLNNQQLKFLKNIIFKNKVQRLACYGVGYKPMIPEMENPFYKGWRYSLNLLEMISTYKVSMFLRDIEKIFCCTFKACYIHRRVCYL